MAPITHELPISRRATLDINKTFVGEAPEQDPPKIDVFGSADGKGHFAALAKSRERPGTIVVSGFVDVDGQKIRKFVVVDEKVYAAKSEAVKAQFQPFTRADVASIADTVDIPARPSGPRPRASAIVSALQPPKSPGATQFRPPVPKNEESAPSQEPGLQAGTPGLADPPRSAAMSDISPPGSPEPEPLSSIADEAWSSDASAPLSMEPTSSPATDKTLKSDAPNNEASRNPAPRPEAAPSQPQPTSPIGTIENFGKLAYGRREPVEDGRPKGERSPGRL
jgi:hypothetical protein